MVINELIYNKIKCLLGLAENSNCYVLVANEVVRVTAGLLVGLIPWES
jgi:hypothetical protein